MNDLRDIRWQIDDVLIQENVRTIDWLEDETRQGFNVGTQRRANLIEPGPVIFSTSGYKVEEIHSVRHMMRQFVNYYMHVYTEWQGWVLLGLTGIGIGTFATFIDIASDFFPGTRIGVCRDSLWLNHDFCCWTSKDDDCEAWMTWGSLFSSTVVENLVGMSIYVLMSLVFAGFSALLVVHFSTHAAGSGIPEVKCILSGFSIPYHLTPITTLIKGTGIILSTSAGLCLGKEGPMVYLACGIAGMCMRLFPRFALNESKRREIYSAASAAGVSVAFGAPIGGVLFSLEEVSYYFPHKTLWRAFFCALTAAVTIQWFNPTRTGRLVMFYVQYSMPWHVFEIPVFILIGIAGGLYGALFIKSNVYWAQLKKNSSANPYDFNRLAHYLHRNPIAEVLLVTLVTAVLRYPFGPLKTSTNRFVHTLFSNCDSENTFFFCTSGTEDISSVLLLLFCAASFFAVMTVFTFGIAVPAGLFIPTLAVGACMGRFFGVITHKFVFDNAATRWLTNECPDINECIFPGLYALCGAAAALGGVTRMTVSLAVIIFELTGGLTYIIPVMISVMVSKWTGDALGKKSIYDMYIELRGYPFLDVKTVVHNNTTAKSIVHQMHPVAAKNDMHLHSTRQVSPQKYLCCIENSAKNTIHSLKQLVDTHVYRGYPLIDSYQHMGYLGFINRQELAAFISEMEYQDHYTNIEFLRKENDSDPAETGSSTRLFHHDHTVRHVTNEDLRQRTKLVSFLPDPDDHDNEDPEYQMGSMYNQTSDKKVVYPLTSFSSILINSNVTMSNIIVLLKKLGTRYLLITDHGKLIGIITKKDVLGFIE